MELPRSRRVSVSEDQRRQRVADLRQSSGAALSTLTTSSLDGKTVQGHVENFLGTMSLPLGLIGPLKINWIGSTESVRAPFATTEGALISSISRGALAISLSGGVTPRVLKQEMVRAPQFEFASIDIALQFRDWTMGQSNHLSERIRRKSSHASLKSIEPFIFSRTVHLRCVFTTGNAAGQNMTTFFAADISRWLCEQFEIETGHACLDCMIEGNLSSDKKVSAISAQRGRGHSVTCEVTISAKVLQRVFGLKIDEVISRFHRSKSARIYSGVIGYNINVANVVAGLFLSTGQDAACIHESSVAELHLEAKGEDLYASLLMPNLVVGTVGGGTQLPSARDCLTAMNCTGDQSSDRLAMIIASFSLALELSTLTAIGTGSFVTAHERHARQLPTKFFKPADLTEEFFKQTLADSAISKILRLPVENREGYVSDLAFQVSKKYSGNLAFEIITQSGETQTQSQRAFLKMKPNDREIVLGAARVLASVDPALADLLSKSLAVLPFKNCHLRELQVFQSQQAPFRSLAPRFLGSYIDSEKEVYILIQELLEDGDLISPVLDLSFWTEERQLQCLLQVQKLHEIYLLKPEQALADVPTLYEMIPTQALSENEIRLWEDLGDFVLQKHLHSRPQLALYHDQAIEELPLTMEAFKALPQSVIHYDFNPRNLAFRKNLQEVLIFDWEFTAWGVPQRDFLEFMLFASEPQQILAQLKKHSRTYLQAYADSQGLEKQWAKGLELSLKEFLVRRLPFYAVLAHMGACPYLPRILDNIEVLSKADFDREF